MRILGLDLGSKTLGVACSDPSGILASGIETFLFPEENYEPPLDYVKQFVDNKKVDLVVLGHPKNMDGTIGLQGRKTERFRDELATRISVPIVLWDERLTTRIVTRTMIAGDLSRKARKDIVDKLAATVILQDYLDARRQSKHD
jgi:putative Holliday junction resolvase